MKIGVYHSKKHKKINTTKNNKAFINFNHKNDECYTRKIESDKLVSYLRNKKIISKKSKIWLPFNDKESNIYKSLKEYGYKNLIATETDFYETKVKFDIIISNPPFSNRTKLFTRLMELDKPFILLQPIMFFNNGSCINILINKGAKFGALCPNKRMTFHRNFGFLFPKNSMGFIINGQEKEKTTAFYSFWLCYKTSIEGFVRLPNIENENK